MTYTCISL